MVDVEHNPAVCIADAFFFLSYFLGLDYSSRNSEEAQIIRITVVSRKESIRLLSYISFLICNSLRPNSPGT